MNLLTAELVNFHGKSVQSCDVQFRQFGGRASFHGPVRTIKVLDDNALVKQILDEPGKGAVLVVDGGGSVHTALMGDMLAGTALRNGWAGVIIHGAVRDVAALRSLDLGIKAIGTNPRKSGKTGAGIVDQPVAFGGAAFATSSWVYSDEDGIVVAARPLH